MEEEGEDGEGFEAELKRLEDAKKEAEGATQEEDQQAVAVLSEKEERRRKIEEEKEAKRAAALARLEEKKAKKNAAIQKEREKLEAEAKRLADLQAAQEAAEAEEPPEASEILCIRGGNVRQRKMHGMKYNMLCVKFSPDSQQIATSSNDRSVRVWDVKSGQEVAPIEHKDYVRCVAWSLDGSRICSGCDDRMVRIWRVETKPLITEEDSNLEETIKFRDWVMCVCISPNGEYLCGVTRNQVVLHPLHRPGTASSQQNHRMASNSSTKPSALTDTGPRSLPHDDQTFSACFSSDSEMLVTASGWEHGHAIIFDVASGDELLQIPHKDWVTSVSWSPFGRRVVTTSRDKFLRIWELPSSVQMKSGEELRFDKEEKAREEAARIEAEKNIKKIRISKKKQQELKEAAEREALAEKIYAEEIFKFQHENWTCTASWSPDGKFLCTGGDEGRIRLFAVEKTDFLQKGQLLICFEQEQAITCVEFAPTGRRICTASTDGTARIFGGLHHLWKPPKMLAN